MRIFAFADEASSNIDEQIIAMKRNGISGLEIRNVDGINVSDITLEKAKEVTNCDLMIAVMSGNFVQRGEPAIIDKWKKTEICLEAGIDLVIELPFVYSSASAAYFAYNAVFSASLTG